MLLDMEWQARGVMDTEDAREYLVVSAKLCDEAEWDGMVAGDRHTTVIFWIQATMNRMHQRG